MMAIILSIVATIGASALLFVFWILPRGNVIFAEVGYPYMISVSGIPVDLNFITLLFLIIGAIIALRAAFSTAQKLVKEHKFCENCEQPMISTDLNPSSWESGTQITSRTYGPSPIYGTYGQRPNIQAIADALKNNAGADIQTRLFMCPTCKRGFLENTAHFVAKWKAGTLKKNWLFSSIATSPDETQMFVDGGEPKSEGANASL